MVISLHPPAAALSASPASSQGSLAVHLECQAGAAAAQQHHIGGRLPLRHSLRIDWVCF